MANCYYLIDASKVEQARLLAPANGLPHQKFQVCFCPNGTRAIVQADWTDDEAIAALGKFLGELKPDGSASQAVYDELAKPEWQMPME